MMDFITVPRARFFAGLFTNLAAGWIGVIFIAPNFSDLSKIGDVWVLTFDVFFAILFSWLGIKLEEYIQRYE